jgi:uncharacterized membrane protein YcfT
MSTAGEHNKAFGQRLAWVDSAKAISIVLVVLIHADRWLEFVGADSPWIGAFNELFTTMRMPLFFAMSGLLAQRWIHERSWRQLLTGKLRILIWVFLVWQPIVFLYKISAANFLPDQADSSLLAHLARLVGSPIRPNGETWFLWALVLFFVLAKVTRRVPPVVQVGVAGAISAAWLTFGIAFIGKDVMRLLGDGWQGVFSYYFFFVAALYCRPALIALASRIRPWAAAPIVAIWIGSVIWVDSFGVDQWFPIPLILRLGAVVAGIAAATLLVRLPGLVRLGQTTLPVYLMHTPLIVVAACALHVFGVDLSNEPTATLTPVILAFIAIALSLVIFQRSLGNRIRFLYGPPAWWLGGKEKRFAGRE